MRFSDDVYGRAAVFQPRRRSTTMKRAGGMGMGKGNKSRGCGGRSVKGCSDRVFVQHLLKKLCLSQVLE